MPEEAPRLELRGIGKSFPGVRALSDMNLTFRKGAVHVICGENGAGKSTLLKTINGIIQPDEGEIRFNGEPVIIGSPARARELGISMISQELNYIPEFTVMEMMFLGLEPVNKYGKIDWAQIRKRTVDVLKREKLAYDPDTKLKDLSISDIQMLEIMKAVSQESNVIIMDEPTSAITDREVDILFEKVDELRAKGAAIIYVSHRLDELFRIADDLSVIRDGRHVETRAAKDFDIAGVIQLMVGRAIDNVFPPRHEPKPGQTKLDVRGLSDGSKYQDVSFTVRAGEVVGFSGLMGAGRTEVARAVFGLDRYDSGEVLVAGKPAKIESVQDGINAGMAMVSEDRKRYGIIPVRSIRENVGLSNLKLFINGGFLHRGKEKELVDKNCSRMRVKAPNYEVTLDALSGGNQQKVVLAKWMLLNPDILILDEPTRGVDVGAKYEIYKMIFELAEEGKAILVISSELPELLGICDRIYVMAKGQVTGELANHEFDSEKIMRFATIGGGTIDVEAVAAPGQRPIQSPHDLGV